MSEKLNPDTAEPLEGLDLDTDLNLQRRLVNDLNANTAGPTALMTVPPNGNSENGSAEYRGSTVQFVHVSAGAKSDREIGVWGNFLASL